MSARISGLLDEKDQMLGALKGNATYREPFGIPTVLQHGRYAQMWERQSAEEADQAA